MTLVVKKPPANAGDAGDMNLIPGPGRSPREGNGNPLQHSCLGNPMERGACMIPTVHGIIRIGHNFIATCHIHSLGLASVEVFIPQKLENATINPFSLFCPKTVTPILCSS